VKGTPGTLILGALALVSACDAERVLAFANAAGAGGGAGNGGAGGGSGGGGGAGQGSPFGPPQLVTGLRGDTEEVQDPSLTFEELEIYFTSPTAGQNDIWVSRRTATTAAWGPSALVTELSSPANDQDPEVSVDGLVMYLASDRGGGATRVYVSQRRTRDTPWGTPALVNTLGASTADEAPALDRAELNLLFASQRGTATGVHLFGATRPDASAAWPAAAELTALSSAWEDSDPALFAEGSGFTFASRRLTQGGTADLFTASRSSETAPFTALVPLTELNTASNEEDPWLSQDGSHIVFASDRSGSMRIYEARR
jgi:Tol biopolymer transport system component